MLETYEMDEQMHLEEGYVKEEFFSKIDFGISILFKNDRNI